MKIVHITHHYIDGWGYQDNLLPLYQYRLGNEITVISDKNHLDIAGPNIKQHILNKGDTYFLDGVKIRRIECILNTHNASLISKGLYKILEEENPDLIFHHGINTAMLVSAYYKSKHKSVILFVDSHADKFNQSRSKILYLFYYRILLRGICNIISSKVDQYYGVSVARCNYLNEVYGIPNKKIALLPLGGDTDLVDSLKDSDIEIQNEYNIPPNAFVIIHGGKMDKSKGTINLIKAFIRLCGTHKNFYLILFGRMSDAVKIHAEQNNIILINWCDRIKTIELLKFANVAVWPLLHTTLIEDAVSNYKVQP